MIGKPEWFTYRIFGWGLRPKTWQGWLYVVIIMALCGLISLLPAPDNIKSWLFGAVITIFIIDVLIIMTKLSKVHDERENKHQLIIERNASFTAVVAIVAIMLFQVYQNRFLDLEMPFDKSLLIVLIVMVVMKGISTIYVNKKM
ncbi:MAG: hypothetical protein ABIC91_08095 [Nanoarchaeota archaeon]|nr:hypothetical protein [Nanoarchaeota archaeon]MBU1850099.1 hypothetical protein [Nanoarchaeota archaeon]